MKLKKLILSLCTMVLGVVAGVFTFLPMFDVVTATSSSSIKAEEFFGLFNKPEDIENVFKLLGDEYKGAWKVIAAVLACVVIACVLAYIVLFFMDNKKGKTKYSKLRKFIGVALAVLAIVIAVMVLVYVLANKVTLAKTTTSIYASSVFGVIAITVFPFIAGVTAVLAEKK